MYVRRLTLDHLRTFEQAQLEFRVPGEPPDEPLDFDNVTLLLGDNAAGKTTILRALALASLAPIMSSGSGFVPHALVRRTAKGARIAVDVALDPRHEGDQADCRLEVDLLASRQGFVDRFRDIQHATCRTELMWEERSPAFLVVGYGASRRVDATESFSSDLRYKSRALRYARVASLFEEAVTMVPLSSWLPRLREREPERQAEVVKLLSALLAPHVSLVPEPEDDEYLFRLGGSALPFRTLSDGYRAYIGWVADLLHHMCTGLAPGTPLAERTGIVLVDEVDLHLHPEWQQRVIPTVARALPRMQFIFTSHSPLLVGTLHRANVLVLEAHELAGVRTSRVRPAEQEVYGLSADQLLTSGAFGLASARPEAFARLLRDTAQTAQAGDTDAALRLMRLMTLGGAGVVAEGSAPTPAKRSGRESAKAAGGRAGKKAALATPTPTRRAPRPARGARITKSKA